MHAQLSSLDRFVDAQDANGTFERALAELRDGRKRSHWMWFVFPQVEGLGRSAAAKRYAIAGLDEATRYLAHPVLGPRLHAGAQMLLAVEDRTADQILGAVDAMKLRSSMTLFARAAPGDPLFQRVLDRYFGGEPDDATDQLLAARSCP
jgi:uncharacterized protein (DUF1810 family)